MKDYFDKGHAELVPAADLEKPPSEAFYLPMHAVKKESSTTTKIRAVFDALAKSSTGVSLNDILLVRLLWFQFHRIALTTDVSKMFELCSWLRIIVTCTDLYGGVLAQMRIFETIV